ncbi:FGGY-family carbohydrate kinase, partial [Lentzea pudingi]|uniref:FGGY-family carbohydrate kinase n=1 Tax=Lentzea pudingi TaxID=1789439 RepID=UPI00227B00E8
GNPGSFTLAAGMATSGAVTDWLRGLVGGDFTELARVATEVSAGARGLLLLPYFAGERTPLFDPRARGVLAGLTTGRGSAELYRAVLEATAYGVRYNLEAMRAAGGTGRRMVAVGGGTRGGLWPQIVSDVIGAVQDMPAETVGACLGDAMLAAEAISIPIVQEAWNPVVSTVQPAESHSERYERYYRRYRDLYEVTAGVTHFLAAEQE